MNRTIKQIDEEIKLLEWSRDRIAELESSNAKLIEINTELLRLRFPPTIHYIPYYRLF